MAALALQNIIKELQSSDKPPQGRKRRAESKPKGEPKAKVVKLTKQKKKTVDVNEPVLLGNLTGMIDVAETPNMPYLTRVYFVLLLGVPPYSVPDRWPNEQVVTITTTNANGRRRKQQSDVVSFGKGAFLSHARKRAHFSAFMLAVAHNNGINGFRMYGDFRKHYVGSPKTAIDHVLRQTCFVY